MNKKLDSTADIIIVGTGAAGLYCALHLSTKYKIIMITKDRVDYSDSFLAQGGISTLKNPDDYESYYEDTMKAGHYENNGESVHIMIDSSMAVMKELVDFGVEFDKVDGEFSYTREGAHSAYRILHHKDITGYEITSKLLKRVQERDNINILEYTTMLDIIKCDNRCTGIIIEDRDKLIDIIHGKTIVWATGGVGGLFEHSTNYSHLTGDSLGIAMKHGITIQDINYIQIHPTTLYSDKPGRRYLISESVRGEGGILLNQDKKRFVDELLPRDVVCGAIKAQMAKFHSPFVYLSVKHLKKEKIKLHFPNIYDKCLEEGYDMYTDDIPVTPAQHYFMGGVKVDMNSETSLKNLYAIGETSCNGVHGANRLASNSLLESLVFAKRAAISINAREDRIHIKPKEICLSGYNTSQIMKEYQEMVLNEIKRKDEDFYVKWCNNGNKCG